MGEFTAPISETMICPGSRMVQGPLPITEVLRSLGEYKFCPHGVAGKVHYDVVSLNPEAGGGILLTTHGLLVKLGPGSNGGICDGDHNFSIDQSFVLLRNRENPSWEDG